MMSSKSYENTTGEQKPKLAYELSLVVAFATGAEPNYCYTNAWHAILELPLLQDARLVEGWIVLEQTQISVIEHCWCECPDGLIVDPSLVLLIRRNHPVFYFAGIRRDRSEVERLTCRELPYVRSVGSYGSDGMGHTGYRAAYQVAYEQARKLTVASSPPKSLIVQPSVLPSAKLSAGKLAMRIDSSSTFFKE
jgi:hypothetical protein